MNTLNPRVLQACILFAEANWISWRDVYEAKNSAAFLFEDDLFEKFMKEYSLSRTIHRNDKAQSAKECRKHVGLALSALLKKNQYPGNAELVERLGRLLKAELEFRNENCSANIKLPGHDNPFGISLCSKVLTFYDPETFVPYDRYARRGIHLMLGNQISNTYVPYSKNYRYYYCDFQHILKKYKAQVIEAIKFDFVSVGNNYELAFINRTLDVYAMFAGGRWGEEFAKIALKHLKQS